MNGPGPQNSENGHYSDGERRRRALSWLEAHGIEHTLVEHAAVFSGEDAPGEGFGGDVTVFKNLFVRNKDKTRFFMYSLPLHKRADLASLARLTGQTRFSFGSAEQLWDRLRILAGRISPLNVIDVPGTDVEILVDSGIFDCGLVGIHPNDNTASVLMTPESFFRFLDRSGCPHRVVAP